MHQSIAPSALWDADTPPSSRDGAKRYLFDTRQGIELSSCEVHPHYPSRILPRLVPALFTSNFRGRLICNVVTVNKR